MTATCWPAASTVFSREALKSRAFAAEQLAASVSASATGQARVRAFGWRSGD